MYPEELASHIAGILDLSISDWGINGLQVERSGPIRKLLTAVDFSEALLERAVAEKADAVLVHHGVFWGKEFPITGRYYRLFQGLLTHNIALYAYHLPLDVHPEIGNNALLLKVLGAEYRKSFGNCKGIPIILSGEVKPVAWADFLTRFKEKVGEPLSVVAEDGGTVKRIGVCSGGGLFGLEDACREGCDVYITGDAGHISYHPARELGIRLISGGHYNTEVWGVRALGERLEEELGLTVRFIDLPTGL